MILFSFSFSIYSLHVHVRIIYSIYIYSKNRFQGFNGLLRLESDDSEMWFWFVFAFGVLLPKSRRPFCYSAFVMHFNFVEQDQNALKCNFYLPPLI